MTLFAVCKKVEFGIFYKISMEVVKILNKNGLPYSLRVFFAPGVFILPIELDFF